MNDMNETRYFGHSLILENPKPGLTIHDLQCLKLYYHKAYLKNRKLPRFASSLNRIKYLST